MAIARANRPKSDAHSNQVFIWPFHHTHQTSAPKSLKPSRYG